MAGNALIVGAGIGGLSAGIALRQAGWDIRIFERAASARELGFALLVAPNAVAALRELGVADVVLERAVTPGRCELRRMDGTVLKRLDFPPPEAIGGPTVVAVRPALHGALLEAVGPEAVALGCEATGFRTSDTRVTLRLANGDAAQGDLLVGADGVASVIRRVLHPSEPPPRSSGVVAVRGAACDAVDYLDGLSGVHYMGPGVESMVVRAGAGDVYWALSVARELAPDGTRDPGTILEHFRLRLDETFRAVTSATTEMRYDELVDRDPLPFWGRDAVTLLGDAAHPLLPHTGQGAAQAIVDAVELGRALGAPDGVPDALRSYERDRSRKTSALLGQGRRTASVMRTTNPVACYARELFVRSIPVATLVKLFARINRRAGTDVGRA